jgi:hypothetical protein
LKSLKQNLVGREQHNLVPGWLWFSGGKLDVCGTPNQDNPLMPE